MRLRSPLSASLAVLALALPLASRAQAAIVVNIDKSAQQMTVSVDGEQRYVWPVSTGRHGYDTPNGTFKANRMDADHLSQEWDNAPMPHTIFFDMHGHAIHGFFDVKHLGMPVSHGCVRLSPDHAATLFDLVTAEGMSQTTVVVSGETPANGTMVARRSGPAVDASGQPMQIAPDYNGGYQPEPPQPYDARGYAQQRYYQQQPQYQQPQYQQPQQQYYVQRQYYGQPQPYYGQPQPPPGYYAQQPQQQPYYAQQQTFPPQPPPPFFRPFGQ